MQEPNLSILISTHNRPDLVRRAVKSVLASNSGDCEIVVVDDGSTPPAELALHDIVVASSRVSVVQNTGSRGAAGARNFGVSVTTGSIILFLDDDDVMLPSYPERVLLAARSTNEAGFGFSAIKERSGANGGDEKQVGRRYPTGLLPHGAPLRHKISGLGAGFWIRRKVFLTVGGFPTDQIVDEDTSLCCTLAARKVRAWYESEPGVIVYRDHSPTESASAQLTRSTRQETVVACYLRTWQRHDHLFPAFSDARWFLATRYVRRSVKSENPTQTWVNVRSARPTLFAVGLTLFFWVKLVAKRLRGATADPAPYGSPDS